MAILRPSLDDIRGLGNFTQMYRWGLMISEFPSALSGTRAYTSDDINFRAESADVPTLSGTSTETLIRGHKVKQPGLYDYGGQWNLTCIETIDKKIASFLRDWRELCWQTTNGSTGITHYMDELTGTIILAQLDGKNNAIWWYKLIGVFLETVDWGGQFDAQTAEPMKPAITFAFQRFVDGPTLPESD